MIIKIAKNSGFCFGVGRAVDMVLSQAKANKDKLNVTYGMLIHNQYVVNKLKTLGIETIENIENINNNMIVYIRSHGVGKDEFNKIKDKAFKLIDCTCPFVKRIHDIVEEYSNKGYDVIIIGNENHPEVIGIKGYVNTNQKCIVISNYDELYTKLLNNNFIVVCQTTYNMKEWEKIKEYISNHSNGVIFDTICTATQERQNEAIKLAKQVEAMIVIGDKKSSNTNKLYNICSKIVDTYFIQSEDELYNIDLSKHSKIGITAGASTSPEQIDNIYNKIYQTYNKENLNFEEMINNTIEIKKGDIIKGKVVKVTDDFIVLDIGYKSEGIIYKNHFSKVENVNLKNLVKNNDIIEAEVIKEMDNDGNVLLSKIKADSRNGFQALLDSYEQKKQVEVIVKKIHAKSIEADYRGVKVFISINQWGQDVEQSIINKMFKVNIIKVDTEKGIAFASRKDILKNEYDKNFDKIINFIDYDKIYKGKIKKILNKGLMVSFEGLDAYIPYKEISYSQEINEINKIYKIGDEINIKILNIDNENRRIIASIKRIDDIKLGKLFEELYIGKVVEGKIKKIFNFGIVIEFDGLGGFIHKNNINISNNQLISSKYKIGETVLAKIIEIDAEKRRIALTLKDVIEEEETHVEYNENFQITLADLIKNKD